MKWNIQYNNSKKKEGNLTKEDIVKILLENRGLVKKGEIENFLNPTNPENLILKEVGIDPNEVERAIKRIQEAVKTGEQIVVYGDYDSDGICSTAILWESLRDLGANVLPFIPMREKEGYGLSKEGIDSILSDPKYSRSNLINNSNLSNLGLVIAVDSGIVANEAVEYARTKKIDVIVIDHHEKPDKLPKAVAIVHTTQLCAAGISYVFCKELQATRAAAKQKSSSLELAAIATITDLMPLIGPNRSIVKFGLRALNKTSRTGLRALFSVAGIEKVGTYEVGFMIGPRLNASGRIESALLALRMLCTGDFGKAVEYAKQLNEINKQRQDMTGEMTLHALERTAISGRRSERIVVVEHESYHQGIIGLIAGKLVEKYYLPAIVIAKGPEVSKASARSISGFNIIEAINAHQNMLLGAGGHPMAAGFSIETSRIEEFKFAISKTALEKITDDLLDRTIRVDCELGIDLIDMNFYQELVQFQPFGIGNPEPTFAAEAQVQNIRTVGQEGKHLKLVVSSPFTAHSKTHREPSTVNREAELDAIAFNKGEFASKIKFGDKIKIAYNLDLNTFNGRQNLQLKIKDIVIQ